DDEAYSFLVFERGTDALVGGLGLSNVRRGVAQMATLGYWVGQPYARRGHVSGATRLVLDFAFGQLGLHRVEAACLPTNEASRGLLEKVGFTHEGYARGYLRIDGAWRDHVLYAVLREEWRG
ncbi:MAG TPA: GNAT family protein, partial [Azospirillum sp.]